eukprot:364325-Chlamydomonas_euryale.AAC.12
MHESSQMSAWAVGAHCDMRRARPRPHHTGTHQGHTTLGHTKAAPHWDTPSPHHTGTHQGRTTLGHTKAAPHWDTPSPHHTGTHQVRTTLGHTKAAPHWDHTGTTGVHGQ